MTRRALTMALSLLGLGLWSVQAVVAQDPLEVRLEVGEQRVLSGAGVASYSEGVAGVVDVRLTKDGANFVIVGQRPGRTSLLFMMNDHRQVQYRIVVEDKEAGGLAAAQLLNADSNNGAVRVAPRDNIRLDFYFVQFDREDSLQAGLSWPVAFGGGGLNATFDLLSRSFTAATAVIAEQALPRLDFAQVHGYAKVLRQASVITANGTQAEFGGGGELNIPVQSSLSVGMRQIAYGSELRVNPRYDRDTGRLELSIHADISDLTSDHGTGIPGRMTSVVDSLVNLELGESVVIAGLTARSESAGKDGIPGLSQIPIIGALFGVHHRRSVHSQNLIVIVPTVVDAVSMHARQAVREALSLFEDYGGDLERTPLRTATPAPETAARRRSQRP